MDCHREASNIRISAQGGDISGTTLLDTIIRREGRSKSAVLSTEHTECRSLGLFWCHSHVVQPLSHLTLDGTVHLELGVCLTLQRPGPLGSSSNFDSISQTMRKEGFKVKRLSKADVVFLLGMFEAPSFPNLLERR